jgi:hypothetical protein
VLKGHIVHDDVDDVGIVGGGDGGKAARQDEEDQGIPNKEEGRSNLEFSQTHHDALVVWSHQAV